MTAHKQTKSEPFRLPRLSLKEFLAMHAALEAAMRQTTPRGAELDYSKRNALRLAYRRGMIF